MSELQRHRQALREFQVTGIKTTIPFLLRVLEHPRFVDGEVDTGFIDRHLTDLVGEGEGLHREAAALAAVLYEKTRSERRRPAASGTGGGASPWTIAGRRDGVVGGRFR